MSLLIEFHLGENGWARLRVADGEQSAETDASYIEDSLPQLARIALAGLDPDAPRTNRSVDFADEPGGLRLSFEPVVTEPIEERPSPQAQRVLGRVEDLIGLDYPPKGELLFAFETTAAELARIVLGVIESLYDEFGIVGYQRRWQLGELPVAEMVRLRHELGLSAVERRLW